MDTKGVGIVMIVKTGAEISNKITCYEALHAPSLNTKEYVDLVGSGWVPLGEFNECLNMLEDVLAQACLDDKGEFFDSMSLHSYADGIRFLADHGRLVIISDGGRRVIVRLKKDGE